MKDLIKILIEVLQWEKAAGFEELKYQFNGTKALVNNLYCIYVSGKHLYGISTNESNFFGIGFWLILLRKKFLLKAAAQKVLNRNTEKFSKPFRSTSCD